MLVAQARAMALAHEVLPAAKIGPGAEHLSVYPASPAPDDVVAATTFSAIRNWLYLDVAVPRSVQHDGLGLPGRAGLGSPGRPRRHGGAAAGHPDFIAFNYYTTHTVAAPLGDGTDAGDTRPAHVLGEEGCTGRHRTRISPRTSSGGRSTPVGFRTTFREIYDRYHLPLMVTENGLGAFDVLEEDARSTTPYRIEYLSQHVEQMQLALTDGVEVIGFCPWSAIDLVSTHQGVRKRYGFVYVDRRRDRPQRPQAGPQGQLRLVQGPHRDERRAA